MQELVLAQRLGFHATVRSDATPSLSPKGTTTVWDDDHLVFADIASPGTIANLRVNPTIEINVVDPIVRKGWRFAGRAQLHEHGPVYDRGLELLRERGYRATPERVRTIVLVRVSTAEPLVSPAYDNGTSKTAVREAQLARSGLRPALVLPEGWEPPQTLAHESFRLRPLGIADVDGDFEAILDRVTPQGEPDPPHGLTRERSLADLGWHETEFRGRASFAYTVVTHDESRVLGCVYVYRIPKRMRAYACGSAATRTTSIRRSSRSCASGSTATGRSHASPGRAASSSTARSSDGCCRASCVPRGLGITRARGRRR
jgi:hypothetical protein